MKYVDAESIYFRALQVIVNGEAGYKLILRSEIEQSGYIELRALAEDGSYGLKIKTVMDENGNDVEIKGSAFKVDLKAEQKTCYDVVLDGNNNRLVLEVA